MAFRKTPSTFDHEKLLSDLVANYNIQLGLSLGLQPREIRLLEAGDKAATIDTVAARNFSGNRDGGIHLVNVYLGMRATLIFGLTSTSSEG